MKNPLSKATLAAAGFLLAAAGLMAISLAQSASGSPAGNAVNGKILFEKRCTGCHGLDRNKEGPRLRNVYGRKAGAIPGFTYSDALKSANFTWDAARLDRWLTDPESVVPNSDMAFHVSKTQERADVIEFLRASSGN